MAPSQFVLQGESVKSESKDMKIMLFLIHTAANDGVFYVCALAGGGVLSAYSLVPESFCILFGISPRQQGIEFQRQSNRRKSTAIMLQFLVYFQKKTW